MVAQKPVWFISGPVVICLLASVGLLRFEKENVPEKLWIPQDSEISKDYDWVFKTFTHTTRFQTVLFSSKMTGENILTRDTLIAVSVIFRLMLYFY